jgi:hypothetical protein
MYFRIHLLKNSCVLFRKHQKESSPQPQNEKDRLAEMFPCLAMQNDPKFQIHNAEKRKKEKTKLSADDDIVNDSGRTGSPGIITDKVCIFPAVIMAFTSLLNYHS